jgi:mRNA interferase MazF
VNEPRELYVSDSTTGLTGGIYSSTGVVAMTSNLKLAKAAGNVSLPKSKSGLSQDSVANVSRVITLDKESLTELIGQLDSLVMQQVDQCISVVLGL